VKPRLLWLFPEGWDAIAMREASALADRFEIVQRGFDLFRFPENANILWFDARRAVDRFALLARRLGAVGVVSTHEQYGALIAACVARRAGLPGADPRAIVTAQHKYYARRCFAAACPALSPPFGLLPQTFDDPEVRDDAPLPYPFFVKPVKAAYSVLARRVDSAAELSRHLSFRPWERHIIKRLVRPFDDLMREHAGFDVPAEAMLAEGLLDGVQVNVDGWFDRGTPGVFGVVDSVMYPGTNAFARFEYPSRLPPDLQDRLVDAALVAMRALGFDHGAFNVELFWRPADDSIRVIEVNPRLASQFGDLYFKVDGCHPYDVVVDLAVGRTPRWTRGAGRHGAAASFVFREFDGAVKIAPSRADVDWLAHRHPDAHLGTYIKHGHARWREMRWLGSYRYAIVNLGARDRDDLERSFDELCRHVAFERPRGRVRFGGSFDDVRPGAGR
jgi:hypothetical protein